MSSNNGPPDVPPPDTPPLEAPAEARYTQEDLQIITKLCMNLFLQAQANCPKPETRQEGRWKSQLKAKFPDLYFEKSYMDCYHFCQ